MMVRGGRLRGVEILKQAGREEMTALAEEKPLLVSQGKDPGKLRCDLLARSPIRPGEAAWGQSRAADRRPTQSIRGKEPF